MQSLMKCNATRSFAVRTVRVRGSQGLSNMDAEFPRATVSRPIREGERVRAAVATGIDEADPLSRLTLRDDWPDLVAPEDHSLVRVGATSINMHDLWSMRGVGVRADQFPMVLGCDIAGWDQHGNE